METRRYFGLWNFERDGRFYERLGVRRFKRFATQGDYWNKRRRLTDPSFRNVKGFRSAIEWEARTRHNEVVHLCSLVVGLTMMVWLYSRREYERGSSESSAPSMSLRARQKNSPSNTLLGH